MIKLIECTVSDAQTPAPSTHTTTQVAYVRRRRTTEKQSGIHKYVAGTYQVPPCPPAILLNTLA